LTTFRLLLAALATALFAAPVASLAQDVPADGPHTTVSLIADTKTVAPGQTLHVALVEKIQKGWHTYWVNPGDSGLPTTIDWSLPEGFKAGDIQWPAPKRIPFGPLMSYGYEDQVALAVDIAVPKDLPTGKDVTLTGHANWLVCSNVCVPEEADIKLVLPAAPGPATPDPVSKHDIRVGQRAWSMPAESPFNATATYDKDQIKLHVAATSQGELTHLDFFPLDEGVIDNDAAPQITAGKDGVTILVKRAKGQEKPLSAFNGVLTYTELIGMKDNFTNQSIRIAAPAKAGAIAAGEATAPTVGLTAFLEAVLLAIGGGIILNLMPCVLPVLSIKALSLVRHAQSHPREVRMQGLAYAAGVLVSFGIVAGALIVRRAARSGRPPPCRS